MIPTKAQYSLLLPTLNPTVSISNQKTNMYMSRKRIKAIPPRKTVTTKSSMLTSLNEFATSPQIELVSHSVIAFTFLYTSMNWYYYRRLRKEYEEEQQNDKNKK